MQVTIIGSGNIATVLGRLLLQQGYGIHQVYSRNMVHAQMLAAELNAAAVSDAALIDGTAGLYLLAVTDDAMPAIAAQLSLGDKLLLHTAGSVSKEILKGATANYGVLWPMKMIRRQMTGITPVTIVVDGNSEAVIKQAKQIAGGLSDTVTVAGDELRIKMHMLAAVTSNFTNHLYQLAADYCLRENIDFSLFYPIIEETAQAIQANYPGNVQAGPAMRNDRQTLEKHRLLLQQYPQLEQVYGVMSNSIQELFANRPV